ncbi:conserved protein, unknown function [Plasmodium gallinaceum]|uniref:Uncharacterized protein n=1 Tax=Plasmodium gallinaceum TaxID=5849 RepID=A0A1J1GM60_PLAGA|nr:conserved protein, unknown function [Plasmodium gallinaceum]CRG93481.1 conserved protein, unknown function [Plasmodium gallinaceum]
MTKIKVNEKIKKKKKTNNSLSLNLNDLDDKKEKKRNKLKNKNIINLEKEKNCDKEVCEENDYSNKIANLNDKTDEKITLKNTESYNNLQNDNFTKIELHDEKVSPKKKRKRNNEKNEVIKDSKCNLKNNDKINEEEISSDDKSSSSDEDHDGLLLTSKFKNKFSKLLLKLKNKDENLLNKKEEFFHDSDFDTDISDDKDNNIKEDEEKLNKNICINKNIEENNKSCKTDEKCLNYSEYFKDILLKEGSNAFDKEEEEIIERKKKILSQKNKKSYFDEQEELKRKIIEACKDVDNNCDNDKSNDDNDNFFIMKEKSEKELLEEKKYYETFLKTSNIVKDENNLLKEYWKDNLNKDEEFLRDYILKEMWREDKIHNIYEDIDEIDDEELEKAENFERTYNFRYEEQNGNIVNSNPRNIESSVRIDLKKKKKKEKRKEKRKKKRDRKKILLEELKKEKKEKNEKSEKNEKNEKNNSFNSNNNNYDKTQMIKNKNNSKEELDDQLKKTNKYDNNIISNKHSKIDKNLDLYNNENDLWFLCDECKNPISPLNYVYECNTCENFSLCKKCFKQINHEHKLKKMLVPKNCKPPKEYLNNIGMNSNYEFNNNNNCETMEYLENDSSGYEDLIDDMPIRFKYVKVKPNSFNLTTDFILNTDDKTLNKMVPLKYVSPYYKKNFISNVIEKKEKLNE